MKGIHFEIAGAIVLYFVISTVLLLGFAANPDTLTAFVVPVSFGVISTWVFLYLFSNKNTFGFAKKLEKEERKKEKQYLSKYAHLGKLAASLVISLVGGPIFLALTLRFLFARSKNKYWIGAVLNMITTSLLVAMSRGLLGAVFVR